MKPLSELSPAELREGLERTQPRHAGDLFTWGETLYRYRIDPDPGILNTAFADNLGPVELIRALVDSIRCLCDQAAETYNALEAVMDGLTMQMCLSEDSEIAAQAEAVLAKYAQTATKEETEVSE
jgi:hypothetical protein